MVSLGAESVMVFVYLELEAGPILILVVGVVVLAVEGVKFGAIVYYQDALRAMVCMKIVRLIR